MSIPVPLTVRISTSRRDMHLTSELRDLTFRSTSPGGFASATFPLDRPLTLQPDEIALYGRVYIYDGRSGETVWEGRLEDPGRSASDQGEVWELTAVGPAAHASDRRAPLIYVVNSLDDWRKSRYSSKSAQIETGELSTDDDVPAITMKANEGATVTTAWLGDVINHLVQRAGFKLAQVVADWIGGFTSTGDNFAVGIYLRTDGGGSPGAADTANVTTTGGTLSAAVGGTNFSNGHNVASLRLNRNNSSATITSEDDWVSFYNVTLKAMRLLKDGSEKTSAYSGRTVAASSIVEDLLGRLLPLYDGANAKIFNTTYNIDHLAYPDGVSPAQVLEDLLVLEPACTWHAWETNPATGKWRFEFVLWPTTVRYECDVTDGIDSPGSADGLYNAVIVRWTEGGRTRSKRLTRSVPVLTAAGLTREAEPIDLGEEAGSSAAATAAGNNFLADHANPPNAGTLTIARPIRDLTTGRIIQPWQIRPGELVRVRGILPRPDALNATTRDAVTVFRIVSTDYTQSTNSANLELDSYPASVARAIANQKRRRRR